MMQPRYASGFSTFSRLRVRNRIARLLALALLTVVAGCTAQAHNTPVIPAQPPAPAGPKAWTLDNVQFPFKLDTTEAYLIEGHTGTVLYAYNPDQRLQPGSVTKLMTFYLTLNALSAKRLSLDTLVPVGDDAAALANDPTLSRMHLKLGQRVTVRDLLFGMMVHSGCDAAQALADYEGGTSAAFVASMNREAQRIGMLNTHFSNPMGLPVPGEYTSAKDLVTLGRVLAEEHPEAFEYTSKRRFKFNGFNQASTNGLLFLDPRVRGLKTGHVQEAGFHLVGLTEMGDLQLISAVMGAPSARDRVVNSYELIIWASNSYAAVRPDWHGTVPNAIRVRGGDVESVAIAPVTSPLLVVSKNHQSNFTLRANVSPTLTAPVRKGQVVGELTVSVGSKAESIPIQTLQAATPPPGMQQLVRGANP
jgi:serine-type D-Ala-D-Ala carboxypeptidase (penicillin-binding protein 5/6)